MCGRAWRRFFVAHELAVHRQQSLQVLTERQRRAILVSVAGERRWIPAEDAGLYRDALGVAGPPGLPDSFLAAVDRPLERLLRRYARHHGPFLTRDAARRYALRPAQIEPALRALEAEGVLVRGEIRPGGAELDWCDAEILRRLKRRTLARLRDEVAPAEASAMSLFLPQWQGIDSGRPGPERLLEAIGQLQDLALPWSVWSTEVLPRRVAGFSLDLLDMLAASGAVVWIGRGAGGPRDGRIALYLRASIRDLAPVDPGYETPTALHAAIIDALRSGGASFLTELEDRVDAAVGDHTATEFRAALWDLVWAGQITNDTFAPLRALGRAPAGGRRRRRGLADRLAGGRWSLVATLVPGAPDPTRRAVARASLLLDRYGIVSREAAVAEELPGGFGPLYKVLKEMEDTGRVRRGYFVEGLSGAQFSHPGAVDRLRSARPDAEERDRPVSADEIVILAVVDPANPYGALLPWPDPARPEQARPRRVPGAWVLLARGRPVLYVAPRGRRIVTFPTTIRDEEGSLEAALAALRRLPRTGRRSLLVIERVDGVPAPESDLLAAFREAGYGPDYRGLIDLRPADATTSREDR
jgi:ATP-dependent Lhr-like helicase